MTVGSLPQGLDGLVRADEGVRRRKLGRYLGRWAGGVIAAVAGCVSMNPLSAICLILAGLSLVILSVEEVTPRGRLLARGFAAAVVFAAVISLSRLDAPWDFHMAPNSGFSFVLIGLALVLLDRRTPGGRRPSVGLAALAAVLALVVTFGYVYDSRLLYGVGRFTPMALNTAICLLILSLGVVFARPAPGVTSLLNGTGPGSVLARRLLPAVIALPIVLGWLRFKGEEFGLFDAGGGVALLATGTMLIMGILIWRSAVSLDRTDLGRGRAERMLQELNDALETRVTERTGELARTNEALLDLTWFLNQVIDTNPHLVFVKDWSGRFTLANKAVADVYGTTVDALVGKTDADFNPNGDEVSAYLEADREVMMKRRVKVIPEEPVTGGPTGAPRWFHTIKTPLIERDGSCNRVLGLSTDITAQRHAEGELRRANDELRALFEASPLAICGLTADGYVRTWNHAAEELFGWAAGEVIGRLLPIVPPELEVQHRELRDTVLAGQPAVNIETFRMRKDGERIDVTISTAVLHDAHGAINGVAVVYADMRERKVLEAQLRQAQKMEAVGQLAGGIAHDFNNLLTVIRTASELLLADLGAEDPRRCDVEEIEEAASRAASLTRQLLAFSRQQVLEPRVVDLNRVITELEPLARRLVEENITVVIRLADDLHPVTADRSQLDQVVLNLVVNARDAMPDGGTLLIETSNAAPGSHVLLRVTDTGCGMTPDTMARIFEPFFTTKPVGQGTGLGLATVYGIVKQSGGHVWASSQVGNGSTFRVSLPRGDAPAVHQEPVAPTRCEPATDEAGSATILVVEDDASVRSAVCRLLERRGYGVVASCNGRDALAMLSETDQMVDLVISDIVMPEMSGLELRDELKELRPTVPVLLMSGYSEEAITRLGNRESLGPLIVKPFTVDGLLNNIRSVLHG